MSITRRLLISLLAATGCWVTLAISAPATDTASTPTSKPSITMTFTRTPTPSATPIRPAASQSAYTLSTWSAATAQSVLEDLEQAKAESLQSDARYQSEDYASAETTLLIETLLRFPNIVDGDTQVAEILNQGIPLTSGNLETTTYAYLVQRISEAINTGSQSPDNLSEWIANTFPAILAKVTPVADPIFGTNTSNWLVQLNVDPAYTALIAIQENKTGNFSVYPVSSNWVSVADTTWTITTQDLNGNGRSDVIIEQRYDDSSDLPYCTQNLSIYEWNTQEFVQLADHLGYTQVNLENGDCGGWEFLAGDTQAKIIASLVTQGGSGDFSSPLIRKTFYTWTGSSFEWAGEQIRPYVDSGDEVAAANWAYEAGPQNSQAVQILENTIDEWPSGLEKEWGPAAEDFFQYKLGIWYAFQGEPQKAVDTLADLRDHPNQKTYTTASQMAATFLSAYPTTGSFAGCSAVIDQLWDDYEALFQKTKTIDEQKILDLWGFTDQNWNEYDHAFTPAAGRSQETVICSLAEAFQSSLSEIEINDQSSLRTWLSANKIPWFGLYDADLNGDDLKDFLVMIQSEPDSKWALWALIQQTNGTKAIQVTQISNAGPSNNTAYRSFEPGITAGMMHAYQVGQDTLVFHIVDAFGSLGVSLDYTGQDGWWPVPSLGVSTWMVDVRGQSPSQQLAVLGIQGTGGTISWDADRDQLVGVHTDLTQAEQIQQAEENLFTSQDRTQAETLLRSLFRSGIRVSGDSTVSTSTLRPYLLYLLGLSYEMDGNTQNAVQFYYQLWQEYPENPYTIIVRAKLTTQ